MCLIFKMKVLIHLSRAKLDGKILFGKITHHLDPEMWKMLVRASCFNLLVRKRCVCHGLKVKTCMNMDLKTM